MKSYLQILLVFLLFSCSTNSIWKHKGERIYIDKNELKVNIDSIITIEEFKIFINELCSKSDSIDDMKKNLTTNKKIKYYQDSSVVKINNDFYNAEIFNHIKFIQENNFSFKNYRLYNNNNNKVKYISVELFYNIPYFSCLIQRLKGEICYRGFMFIIRNGEIYFMGISDGTFSE